MEAGIRGAEIEKPPSDPGKTGVVEGDRGRGAVNPRRGLTDRGTDSEAGARGLSAPLLAAS